MRKIKEFKKETSSCPARGMGVEISVTRTANFAIESCPARGMGVEMGGERSKKYSSGVMPREGHGSRNYIKPVLGTYRLKSCPARGMGVEMICMPGSPTTSASCPARGMGVEMINYNFSMDREPVVMPREGHGSRNHHISVLYQPVKGHAPRGAWE